MIHAKVAHRIAEREGGLPLRFAPLTTREQHVSSSGKLAMANVLVRDLDDDVLKRLKAAARAHGRSLQAEIHDVLHRASSRNLAETRRLSERWLKRLRKSPQLNSAAMIRDDRDKR